MRRPPDVENIRDFNQYYISSWIARTAPSGKYFPTYIVRVGDEQNIQVRTIPNEGGELLDEILTWRALRDTGLFGHPRVGTVNLRETSGYITRNSNRTAHRGYRPGGVRMHVFGMWTLSNAGSRVPVPQDYQVIFNIFNPTYLPLRTLLDQMEQGERVAGAISSKVSLAMEEGFSWPSMYYGAQHVGYLEHGYLLSPIDSAAAEYARIIKDKFPEIRVQE